MTDAGLWVQMLQLLAPEGLLLQSSAPQVFCGRLMAEGALPLAKVNLDTMEHIKSLKVGSRPLTTALKKILRAALNGKFLH